MTNVPLQTAQDEPSASLPWTRLQTPHVLFALVLLLGGGLLFGATWHIRSQSEANHRLEARERSHLAESTLAVRRIDNVLSEIDDRVGYEGSALTVADHMFLVNGRGQLLGVLESQSESPFLPVDEHGEAHMQLGRIQRLLQEFAAAEASFKRALEIARQSVRTYATQMNLRLWNSTTISLCGLLTDVGRFDEAEEFAREVIESADILHQRDPFNVDYAFRVALGYRSLGLLLERRGLDGIPSINLAIGRLVSTAERIEKTPSPAYWSVPEFLIDSFQVRASLHLERGEYEQAALSCRASIKQLTELRRYAALPFTTNAPYARYRALDSLLKNNLAAIESRGANADTFEGSCATPPIQWRMLNPAAGSLVSLDVLMHGRLAGEFEPQAAIVLVWADEDWAHQTLIEIVAAVKDRLRVLVLLENSVVRRDALAQLAAAGIAASEYEFIEVPLNTVWIRDYGPLSMLTRRGPALVDTLYVNGKGFPRYLDENVPRQLSEIWTTPVVRTHLMCESGAMLVNGAGLCLFSTKMLQMNLDAGLSEEHVTTQLKRVTGAERVAYLEPLQDEPNGHVDWFATFTAPDTLLLGDYTGTDPQNAELLDSHARQLAGTATTAGPLKVVRIPMPPRGAEYFGGSYTNVVYANGTLLFPTWRDSPATEQRAMQVYRDLLPDWEIIPIDSHQLGMREGGLHCLTMNLQQVSRLSPVD